MLSDEEKTALEFIKINNEHKYCGKDDVDFLLNLIEKQSKEIEELKEDNEHQWEERCKLTFELENSISNDKIKAIIEELDIEIQCCEYADDDTEEYKKDIEKEKRRLLRDKKVLQSLLEKE